MCRKPIAWLLAVCLVGTVCFQPRPVVAQERGSRYLALGLTGGAGLVQTDRRADAWKFGPVFGGRFEWSRGASAAWMVVDVQPFRAERTSQAGDFRAIYILPTYAMGSESRRIAIGLGMGVFDFTSEVEEDAVKVGLVIGVSGSYRLSRSNNLELGWKRIRNVNGLRANVFSLQLVQRWRF